MVEGILIFNTVLNRYLISFDDGQCVELHCGDRFECLPDLNGWTYAKIEYDGEWYLIDKNDNKIEIYENMFVRK